MLEPNKRILTIINKIVFDSVAVKFSGNIDFIYSEMIRRGLDEDTLGFWIWDIPNNKEVYSPKFRKTLGFKNEKDFANVPESWQRQIVRKDLDVAFKAFDEHVESKGQIDYLVPCTYRKKFIGRIKLICQGQVIAWDKTTEDWKPVIMIGLHWK